MQSGEVYRMLSRKIRRGMFIFAFSGVISVLMAVLAVVRGSAWSLTAIVASFLSCTAWRHVRRRNVQASNVAKHPEQVFWVQPVDANHPPILKAMTHENELKLHFRDGSIFDVELREHQIGSFVDWLRENNSTVFVGKLDSAETTPSIDGAADKASIRMWYSLINPRMGYDLVTSTIAMYIGISFFILSFAFGVPGAISGCVVSVILGCRAIEYRRKNEMFHRIATMPQRIYWAQPYNRDGDLPASAESDCTSICLHLRDGHEFKFDLSKKMLQEFIKWFKEKYPVVFVGRSYRATRGDTSLASRGGCRLD